MHLSAKVFAATPQHANLGNYVSYKPRPLGRDWPVRERGATRLTPGAAVHRHILNRMNAINDSLKKKKTPAFASG